MPAQASFYQEYDNRGYGQVAPQQANGPFVDRFSREAFKKKTERINVDDILDQAEVAEVRGALTEASALYMKILQAQPSHAEARTAYNKLLNKMNSENAAQKAMERRMDFVERITPGGNMSPIPLPYKEERPMRKAAPAVAPRQSASAMLMELKKQNAAARGVDPGMVSPNPYKTPQGSPWGGPDPRRQQGVVPAGAPRMDIMAQVAAHRGSRNSSRNGPIGPYGIGGLAPSTVSRNGNSLSSRQSARRRALGTPNGGNRGAPGGARHPAQPQQYRRATPPMGPNYQAPPAPYEHQQYYASPGPGGYAANDSYPPQGQYYAQQGPQGGMYPPASYPPQAQRGGGQIRGPPGNGYPGYR